MTSAAPACESERRGGHQVGVDSSEGRGQGQLLTLAAGPLQSIAGLRVTHKRESETSKKKNKTAQMKFTATFNPTRAFRKDCLEGTPALRGAWPVRIITSNKQASLCRKSVSRPLLCGILTARPNRAWLNAAGHVVTKWPFRRPAGTALLQSRRPRSSWPFVLPARPSL